jgi:RNA-directed DNA polymerase
MEGRQPTKENIGQATAPRTQSRISELSDLHGVRKAARKDKRTRFTALLHHVTVNLLRDSYYALKREAAPGVDGVTWKEYETGLDEKLADLHGQIHRGTYRAQPSKRAYIPKADGRQRPLGIAALEDKIVQQAVVTVLNQIYEEDFLGFSYGFRLGRSQHDALDALWVGIMRKKVNWILDADVRGFFDNLSHEWLVKFIEHRIAAEDTAPDPEMAEGGSVRGREVVEDGGRDPTRGSSLTAAGEHLPALRLRSVGQVLA